MMRLARLQLVGPVALFSAVLVAEGAAYALASTPSSEFLWYLNLEWFAAFRRSHFILSTYVDLSYLQPIVIAGPLLLSALIGFTCRLQLPLAAASNLSFVFATFVAYSWWRIPTASQASLLAVNVLSGPDFYLIAVLLCSSLFSFVVSHVLYLRAVRARV